MRRLDTERGQAELKSVRRESRSLFWVVALFSFFVNLLMLTGPIYMLQVYDRVLGSRSFETLLALSVLAGFLFLVMGLIDYARGRIMARVGARFQSRLDRRVFDAVVRKAALRPDEVTAGGLRDLESVQRLISSPVLIAVFDIPWTPFFLAGILLFHPWLGYLALAGGTTLVLVTVLNQILTRQPVLNSNIATFRAETMSERILSDAELVQSMGMRRAVFDRWQKLRNIALKDQMTAADLGGAFSSATKAFRLFLQSAMLGLGAYLVLRGELTPGAMIAGSILLGRALAPVEMAIGQWALVQRGTKGWSNLEILLSSVPIEAERTPLPRPKARLVVDKLTVVPPGQSQAALRVVSFAVGPGKAVGVIGPSGAGKSTLARALVAVWRPAGGSIRLDGATLAQYEPDVLGQHIGYLPQRVQLFDGTIAENIARLSATPDPQKVVAAAQMAAAHELILNLPEGYDTQITAAGGRLSGGQIQRIGLARALYGDPVLLVLDEPNSNLDNVGSEALNAAIRAIKKRGSSVLIMAHRPAAIQECDLLLVLDGGTGTAFGPKDEVLRSMVKNHRQIQCSKSLGGVQ